MWPFRNRARAPVSVASPLETNPFRGVRVHLKDLIQARHAIGHLGANRRTRSHALLAGGERSPFKGRGIDFEESRRYQPGDDVRLMDWRVTARTNEPHVKVFREERERPVFMVVDDRQTMHFGTKVAFKSVVAAQAAALLGWASHARGDRVGGIVFAEADHVELRPKGGRTGILQLLNVLADRSGQSLVKTPGPGSAATSFRLALNRVLKAARPGSLIFLFFSVIFESGINRPRPRCVDSEPIMRSSLYLSMIKWSRWLHLQAPIPLPMVKFTGYCRPTHHRSLKPMRKPFIRGMKKFGTCVVHGESGLSRWSHMKIFRPN